MHAERVLEVPESALERVKANAAESRTNAGVLLKIPTAIIAAKKKRRTEVRRFEVAFSNDYLRRCCNYPTGVTDRAH